MPNTHCPYLTSWNAQGRTVAPISYPSFENHCVGQEENSSLLLADQATYCLSGSHHFCPIYTALAAEDAQLRSSAQQAPPQWQPFQRPPSATATQGAQPFIPWEQGSSTTPRTAAGAHFVAGESAFDDASLDEPFGQPLPPQEQGPQPQPDPLFADEPEQDQWVSAGAGWPLPSARWWAWVGAVLLFFAVLGTGSLIAAYAGWQLALEQLATARGAGQISTLDNPAVALQPQVQPLYVVMTATSESEPVDQSAVQAAPIVVQPRTGQGSKPEPVTGVDAATPQAQAQNNFPAAVTATPVIIVPLPTAAANANVPSAIPAPPTATPVPIQLPPAADAPTSLPVIDVQLQIPTRRETPVFDIPTSTPTPEVVEPTPTNTLVPILGTPIVLFTADQSAVPPGKCTKIRWRVENVREVYYENQPMFGTGDRQECLKEDPETFALTVIFADGQPRIYTATVGIDWPTPTPSVTPSFTPEIEPTPTWTPLPPTPTPTPDVVYGTTLSINGENPTGCTAGETCIIGVLATNTGDSLDTLAIEIVDNGSWAATLCSQIGTCGSPRLVVANVGPSNTVFVNLQITIPADSAGQSTNYALRSVSEGAGGAVTSQVTDLTVTVTE